MLENRQPIDKKGPPIDVGRLSFDLGGLPVDVGKLLVDVVEPTHCLGRLAWSKKSICGRDYYISQIYSCAN